MRVLHFVSSLSLNSGVMAVIMNYYRHIDRNKIQFDFIHFDDMASNKTYQDEIALLGGKTYLISKPSLSLSSLRDIINFFNCHDGEFAIIHIHEVYLTFLLAPISHKHGIRVITHCHSTRFSEKFFSATRNRLLCLGINYMTDSRLACSKQAGVFLYGSHANFSVINNAIEINKFLFSPFKRNKIRRSLAIDDKIVIGHVGRLNKSKNHKFIIEIFNIFHHYYKNSILLLVGDGPELYEIKDQIKSCNLDSCVYCLGMRADVADIYNAMDLFLFPSLFEGLGIALIEAQVNGISCLASSCIPSEVDIGGVEFISLKQSAEYWSQKLKESLLSMQQTGYRLYNIRTQEYDIKFMSHKLENEYFKLLSYKINDRV